MIASHPPLLALRAFEAAARHLSFTSAARELYVTQGAISRQIRLLEEFLGAKLFARFVRRVELTPQGEEYFIAIQRALGDIETATRRLRRTLERSVVRISVLPTLGSLWLMPRLASFSTAYPHLDVRVLSSIDPVDLSSGETDVAIRVGRLPGERAEKKRPRIELEMVKQWKDVLADHLFPDTLVPLISRKLLEQGPPITEAADLLAYRLIHTASRRHAWTDWLAAHNVKITERVAGMDFGHFFMGLRAAQDCKGIAIVPTVIFEHVQPGHDLVPALPADIDSAGSYYLLSRESHVDDPAIHIVRNWLLSEAAQVPRRPM